MPRKGSSASATELQNLSLPPTFTRRSKPWGERREGGLRVQRSLRIRSRKLKRRRTRKQGKKLKTSSHDDDTNGDDLKGALKASSDAQQNLLSLVDSCVINAIKLCLYYCSSQLAFINERARISPIS
mmetsp:Transcript_38872/g.62291  ORF Transcript_38872/g.62291 Transcript_38872/m.62291 type:complete len:127 (+) Transcript_38872:1075-1455(+)